MEETPLAWSERSALGFSADELLGALGAEQQTRLVWDDGSSTSLTLGLERGSTPPSFQEREWQSDGSGEELAVGTDCDDVIAIPVTLTFTTNDGAFAEEWPLTLLATRSTSATGFLRLDLDELSGSFVVTSVDPADFDEVLAYLDISFAGDDWTGSISGQATQTGEGPYGSSSAQNFDIASF